MDETQLNGASILAWGV